MGTSEFQADECILYFLAQESVSIWLALPLQGRLSPLSLQRLLISWVFGMTGFFFFSSAFSVFQLLVCQDSLLGNLPHCSVLYTQCLLCI